MTITPIITLTKADSSTTIVQQKDAPSLTEESHQVALAILSSDKTDEQSDIAHLQPHATSLSSIATLRRRSIEIPRTTQAKKKDKCLLS